MVKRCDKCQRTKNNSRKNEMPINDILEVKIFNFWSIDFKGPFPSAYGYEHILVAVNYVYKCVRPIALPTDDGYVMTQFFRKNIFSRYGTLRTIIIDGENHFCNYQFTALLAKYGG